MIIYEYDDELQGFYAIDTQKKQAVGEIAFPMVRKGEFNIAHTYVDEDYGGMGIGKSLVQHAHDYIKEKGLKTHVTCPYARRVFASHEELRDIVL